MLGVIGAGDTVLSKIKPLLLWSLNSSRGRHKVNKQTYIVKSSEITIIKKIRLKG